MSKQEKMEALQARKRQEQKQKAVKLTAFCFCSLLNANALPNYGENRKQDGYVSGDSYNSAEYVRTAVNKMKKKKRASKKFRMSSLLL
jgi:hypothetical protein